MKLKVVLICKTGKVVAPFTGAWIETRAAQRLLYLGSVAPFTGAWIETAFSTYNWITFPVAPFTGAWIET